MVFTGGHNCEEMVVKSVNFGYFTSLHHRFEIGKLFYSSSRFGPKFGPNYPRNFDETLMTKLPFDFLSQKKAALKKMEQSTR